MIKRGLVDLTLSCVLIFKSIMDCIIAIHNWRMKHGKEESVEKTEN